MQPIPGGAHLRFRRLEGAEGELRELAALERECCSFATWLVSSEGTNLVLEVVSAKGDVVAMVRALLDARAR